LIERNIIYYIAISANVREGHKAEIASCSASVRYGVLAFYGVKITDTVVDADSAG